MSGNEDTDATELLEQSQGDLRTAITNLDRELKGLRARQRRLEDGSLAAKVRAETLSWLKENPDSAARIKDLFGNVRR